MTDEMIPMEEEMVEAGRTFTERISVTGGELVQTVQSLLREATVRKITVQDKDGRTLIDIPLYAGIAGALILGSATVLALIAAWFAQVSILIERDRASDATSPTVVGEAVERAAGRASSAASQVVGNVSAFFGSAGHGASDAARRLADSLEARLSSASATTADAAETVADKVSDAADKVAEKTEDAADAVAQKADDAADAVVEKTTGAADAVAQKAGDAADALAEAVEARQCAAITQAGSRCKRPAIAGSEFCSMHQVA